ncbi:MAG TPA: NAD-binding protein [Streptosporangiaceae bacterium]|nr:NAD-binding protein [Streptosporangiaceae bacterium]
MPTVPRRRNARPGHLVVCGDQSLAFLLTEELTTRYGEDVTVILPSREGNHGPKIARLPNVHLIERPALTADAFREARVGSARAVALLQQDDVGNFHAALRAQELNRELRIVLHIFNTSLGERVRSFFHDCAVLSESAVAAPSFVAAALGEPAPSHVRLAGRTLYAARRTEADPKHVICGLADTTRFAQPRILPDDQDRADLVLAVADGTPRDPLARARRRPVRALAAPVGSFFGRKLGAVFLVLFGVLVAGFALLATAGRYSWPNAVYLTLLDAAGAAVTDVHLAPPERFAQVMLTFDGMAFLPTVTAAIVGAKLASTLDVNRKTITDHVIVVGLGNVGTRIVGQLHDLGMRVVCVDRNPNAQGAAMAGRLGVPLVTGLASREETLRAAGIDTCRSLVSVTSADVVNLETALHARSLREDLRIVVRLFDDELAERLEKTLGGNVVSRSVSYLSAPSFAVAMLEHQVLRTIPVGRHVLLIADVPVDRDSELEGAALAQVHEAGQARVIALRRRAVDEMDWKPHQGYLLSAQDRMIVLATRAGLGRVLARSAPSEPLRPGPR